MGLAVKAMVQSIRLAWFEILIQKLGNNRNRQHHFGATILFSPIELKGNLNRIKAKKSKHLSSLSQQLDFRIAWVDNRTIETGKERRNARNLLAY